MATSACNIMTRVFLPVLLAVLLTSCTSANPISDKLRLPMDALCSECHFQNDPQGMLSCCLVKVASFAENLLRTCPAEIPQYGEPLTDFDTGSVDPDLVNRMMSYTHLLPSRRASTAHFSSKRAQSMKRYGGNYDYGMALPWQIPKEGAGSGDEGDKKVFRYGK